MLAALGPVPQGVSFGQEVSVLIFMSIIYNIFDNR